LYRAYSGLTSYNLHPFQSAERVHLGWGVKSKRKIEKWPGSTSVIIV
jgi:hypothetical protein